MSTYYIDAYVCFTDCRKCKDLESRLLCIKGCFETRECERRCRNEAWDEYYDCFSSCLNEKYRRDKAI